MARRRHIPRGRLLITGTILLLLLAAGVLVTGRIINGMAVAMSDRIVKQVGEYHVSLIQSEFSRSEKVLDIATDFVRAHPAASEAERRVLATTLLATDPKAGCVWFLCDGARSVSSHTHDAGRTIPRDGFRPQWLAQICDRAVLSRVARADSLPVWSLARTVRDKAGRRHVCGVDFPLLNIYMAAQNPFSRSSAALFDPEGVIVCHPDSLRLGRRMSDSTDIAAFRKVMATGEPLIVCHLSEYLGLDEERIYYPVRLAGRRWVAGIGIPRLVIEQDIEDFHFYTILTAVISVLFFGALLVVAQRRWRREYDLRRLSEQESAQLHLQRVLDQIDPHFLFNSLNSLYALIRRSPEQAREFTLTLSRVYRHVLERRKQILSTLSEELDFTWQYYTLQKIRFEHRIELTTAVDPALRNRRIPSMSLQTLVENAVKHNSITAANPLHISIRTEGESLVIENNHTPRGGSDAESLGVGLERIRSVYRFYTTQNISIRSADGIFRCRLPLLPPEK